MGGVTPLPSTYTRSSNQLNLAFTTNASVAYGSAQPPLGAGLVPFPPLRQVPCAKLVLDSRDASAHGETRRAAAAAAERIISK